MTLTQRMIERVEFLKAGYAVEVAHYAKYDQNTDMEWAQFVRCNKLLNYLEDRLAR
jgi:hypothetical protein